MSDDAQGIWPPGTPFVSLTADGVTMWRGLRGSLMIRRPWTLHLPRIGYSGPIIFLLAMAYQSITDPRHMSIVWLDRTMAAMLFSLATLLISITLVHALWSARHSLLMLDTKRGVIRSGGRKMCDIGGYREVRTRAAGFPWLGQYNVIIVGNGVQTPDLTAFASSTAILVGRFRNVETAEMFAGIISEHLRVKR